MGQRAWEREWGETEDEKRNKRAHLLSVKSHRQRCIMDVLNRKLAGSRRGALAKKEKEKEK